MKRFICAVALMLPIACWATDDEGYYRPYFMINKNFDYTTCQGYLAARVLARNGNFDAQNQFNQWLDGFLTAYDLYKPDTVDIAYGKDLEYLDGWLDKYCKFHPKDFFHEAVQMLTLELYDTRAKTKPTNPAKTKSTK